METMWLYRMHWRPTFWDDMTDDERAVLDVHAAYVKELHDARRVVLAGAAVDPPTGFVFLHAADRDEARSLMEADPLFPAGIVDITLHAFRAGFIGAGTGYDHTADHVTQASA